MDYDVILLLTLHLLCLTHFLTLFNLNSIKNLIETLVNFLELPLYWIYNVGEN